MPKESARGTGHADDSMERPTKLPHFAGARLMQDLDPRNRRDEARRRSQRKWGWVALIAILGLGALVFAGVRWAHGS